MNQSPGHRKWPEHQVREERVKQRVQAEINGGIIADSRNVLKVDEDRHPPRYYFPRIDVAMGKLERSETTTKCPFKGTAHYYHIQLGDQRREDAAWTYETPYQEHPQLQDRIAFYDGTADQTVRIQFKE